MAGHTPGPWNKEQLRGSNGQQVGTWARRLEVINEAISKATQP